MGANDASSVPSVLTRAMKLRVSPPMLVKLPPTIIRPSGWNAIEVTRPAVFGSKSVSVEPFGLMRARLLRITAVAETPLLRSWLKLPPRMIRPSGWISRVKTVEFGPGTKSRSALPSALRRATKGVFRAESVVGWMPLKRPAMTVLPSVCRRMANTSPKARG